MAKHQLSAASFEHIPPGAEIPGLGRCNEAAQPGDLIVRFDAVSELCEAIKRIPVSEQWAKHFKSRNLNWTGGVSFTQALAMARTGDPKIARKAEALLEQIDPAKISTARQSWIPAPAGAYPIVPEFLAGSPTAMRTTREDSHSHGLIKVCVGLTSSSGFEADRLLRRGMAIVALVQRLQELRPVDLYLLSAIARKGGTGNTLILTRVENRPMDLSVVGFLLGNCGFDRHIHHYLTAGLSPNVGSSLPLAPAFLDESGDRMKELLGLEGNDLYIQPAYLNDTLIRQPIPWITAQLAAAMNEAAAVDTDSLD